MHESNIYLEATDIANNLKLSLEKLCATHQALEKSMPSDEQDASFSVIGKVGAIIDIIETIKEAQPTDSATTALQDAIADGIHLNQQIQLYLAGAQS
jgi:hypothetical protein